MKKAINTYTAVVTRSEGAYIGFVEEVPGVNSQGETEEEAFDNLKIALEGIVEANRETAEEQLSEICDHEKKHQREPYVAKRAIHIKTELATA